MKHVFILISLLLIKSCGASDQMAKTKTSEDMPTQEILSGTYEISALDAFKITDPLSITFDSNENRINGFAGCNRFFGSYKTKGNTISFSQVGITKMLCQDEANQIEQRFLEILNSAKSFEFTETGLTFLNNGEVLVEAKRVPEERNSTVLNDLNIIYNATTRGFFERIWIEGSTLRYTTDRALEDIREYEIPKEHLEELITIYGQTEIEALPDLEPPSKAFAYDGAAMGTLEVTEGELVYKTKIFDHGNPPKPINKLVTKVLSIKETLEKQ